MAYGIKFYRVGKQSDACSALVEIFDKAPPAPPVLYQLPAFYGESQNFKTNIN
jgi:hypothetical protein